MAVSERDSRLSGGGGSAFFTQVPDVGSQQRSVSADGRKLWRRADNEIPIISRNGRRRFKAEFTGCNAKRTSSLKKSVLYFLLIFDSIHLEYTDVLEFHLPLPGIHLPE